MTFISLVPRPCLKPISNNTYMHIIAGLPSKGKEGIVAGFPESLVLDTRSAPHSLHHLLVQLHGGREDLGVSAQDVAKVDVDQVT